MGVARHLEAETLYLREFAKTYESEVGFDAAIEWEMRAFEIWLTDIYHALKHGVVVSSELGDDHAIWIVEGETCDEERLYITLAVICEEYHMCVTKITRIQRVKR